ncbi:DNA-binding transcriptional MerR regulator [Rhodococcus sp. 27YEA15]|uniref:MerR family transcriptional regulator n=1 Tax=Rhodococcus sp. 27YEA15 TaxID=3156259 RepID=UPI003C7C0A1D
MKISELAARSDIPVPTVKYYLREGLLMPGESTSATGAQYGEVHVRRLALVRALGGAGLAIPRIRTVLELVDDEVEETSRYSDIERLGRAIGQLPPYIEPDREGEYPRARRILDRLGQVYEPEYVAVAQLEQALVGLEQAGLTLSDERLHAYGTHIRAIAEVEIALTPTDTHESIVKYAVLATAMYEPVLSALRRLAHQHLARQYFEHTEQEK